MATIGSPACPGVISRREGSAPRGAGMGNSPRACAHAACRPILMGHERRVFVATRALPKHRMALSKYRNATRHVATNAPAPTVDGQRAGKSSRKPRRPRPYSRHLRGYHCDPNVVPLPPLCAYRAPRMPPPMNRVDSIATRRGKGGHATLVRAGTRVARHRPYRERNSQSRK